MATKNKYEDMSVLDALKYVKNRNMLLPDIQREYVWTYPEIEKLFESIVDEYPVGSCIMWKTSRTILNTEKPNLYFFLRDFVQGKSKNEKAPEYFSDETDYYIVLDGQQRITSLNIALFGSFTSFKGGRGHAWDNPKSWITRELYYNLDFYSGTEEDDENPKKRFAFLTTDEASAGNWYKIKQLLAFDDLDSYIEALIEAGYAKDARHDLSVLFSRLHDSSGSGLIHYYCIIENDYYQNIDHKAVPILASDGFVRNTGLNREDALAWLKVSMFERMHPDDVGVVSQISDDFLHQRGPYDIVFRCRMDSVEKDPEAVPEYVQMHGIGKWQTMPDGMELAVITYANLSKTREATLNKVKAYEMFRQDRFYASAALKNRSHSRGS